MELSKGFQSKRGPKWVRTDTGRTNERRTEIGQTHIDFFESPTQYALRAKIFGTILSRKVKTYGAPLQKRFLSLSPAFAPGY